MIQRSLKDVVSSYLMVLPALFIVAWLLLYPMFSNIFLSFFKYSGLGEPVFVGLNNYIRAFRDTNLGSASIS